MHRQAHARAEAEWKQALDLEKKLKAYSRKRSFYDPEVKSLRKQLRDTYESLLFLDAAFAAANDVEGQLWRTVFYMPIEEFRSRIRKAEKEAQQQREGAAAASAVGAADAGVIMAKTAAAFLKFIDDAALFYKRLVMQLQSAYGDVKVRLELPVGVSAVRSSTGAEGGVDGVQFSTGSSVARDMRSSIHRCLVFLGDLSRYASQAAPKAATAIAATAATAAAGSNATAATAANTAAKAEWNRAVGYYRLAAHVLPRSGNPHNQLAVMAFMSGEELKAAYHYARSLFVHVPFMTARENLLQLLQSNRDRYANLCRQRQQQQQAHGHGHGRPVLPMQQQLSELGTCFVRLLGLLFDRINQQEYPKVAKDAFEALAGFLDHPQLLQLLQRQRQYDCTPLHLVVLGIFCVHHSFGGTSGGAAAGGRGAHQEQQQHAANGGGAHSSGSSRLASGEAGVGGVAAGGNAFGGEQRNGSSTGGSSMTRTYAAGAGVASGGPLSPIAAAAPPAAHAGSYGDAAQRSVQRGRSLAMLFRTGRLLAQAATAAVNAEAAAEVAGGACNGVAAAAAAGKTGATNLLVGLNVVLQWLAAQPNCAVLQAATATEEDVKARSKFWQAAGQLLLVLAPALTLPEPQQQQQQRPQQQQQQLVTAGSGVPAAAAAAGGAGVGASAGGGAVSGSMGADASCEEGALPEDLELLGFEPMRSRHYWHVTDVGKHAVDETRTRIKRMLAAARVTSAALAADQHQQLMSRYISSSVSSQSLNQLGAAVQQFVEVVATVAATRTPAASPKVPAAGAAVGAAAAAAGAAAAAAGVPWSAAGLAARSPQQQQQVTPAGSHQVTPAGSHRAASSVTSMDIDTDPLAHEHHHQQQQGQGQQQQMPTIGAAGAGAGAAAAGAAAAAVVGAAAGADEDIGEEEEVIVFKPRISRLSSPAFDHALDDTYAAAAAAAGAASGSAAAGAGAAGSTGSAAAKAPAAGSSGPQHHQEHQQGAAATHQGSAAGAAGAAAAAQQHCNTPPLPQALLAARQPGSAASSPTVRSPAAAHHQQHQQQQLRPLGAAQLAPRAATAGTVGTVVAPSAASAAAPAAAAVGAVGAVGGGVPTSGGLLLRGQAATALDLQQAQAASDLLLARLSATRPGAATAATAAAPGYGAGAAGGYAGYAAAPVSTGYAAAAPVSSGYVAAASAAMAAAGGQGGFGVSEPLGLQLQQAGPSTDLAMEQALLGSGLSSLLGGGGGASGAAAAAGGGVGPVGAVPSWQQQQQWLQQQQQQASRDALAAVSAAVAASMQTAGLQLPLTNRHQQQVLAGQGMMGALGPTPASAAASAAASSDAAAAAAMSLAMGLNDPLATLGMLGIPTDTLGGLSVGIPGLPGGPAIGGLGAAGVLQPGQNPAAAEGLLRGSAGGVGGPMRTVSAGAAAFGGAGVTGVTGVGGVNADARQISAPVGILQQAAAAAAAAAAAGEGQGEQLLGSSYVAQHQMEATAMDAAARVLSPDVHESGLQLLQQHHHQQQQVQQQQQHQQQQLQQQQGLMGVAARGDCSSHQQPLHSRGGSWHSGSSPLSGPSRAETPTRRSGGLSAALQQQQQQHQQLQAHMAAQRRLSAGSESPRLAVAAAAAGDASGAMQGSSRQGRMSLPSPAIGQHQQQQQLQLQRSSIGAMFAGPELFPHSEQLPPLHRRASSGSGSGLALLASGAAAGAGGGDAAAGGAGAAGGVGVSAANGALFAGGLQLQQQQLGLLGDGDSPQQGEGGLTLVEYLAAQQRKLQQQGAWGDDSSNGLQAAAAADADLSAHVLLPPLDFAESQNPFG